jgi:hypothetical protein
MPASVRGREISACLDLERPYGRPPPPGVSPPLIQSFVGYVRIDSDILLGRFSSGVTQMVVFRTPDGPEYTLKVEGQRAVLSGPAGTFSFDLSAEPVVATGSPPRVVRADDPRAALIVHGLRWDGAGAERRPGLLSGEILLRRASP